MQYSDKSPSALRTPAARTLGVAVAVLAVSSAGLLPAAYHEQTLDNGLRVILIEHHANPMVASSVVVGAGVVHEPAGMNGASHLLEHLLFNGTETRTQRELYDAVNRYGAYNNATTREDHTLFSLLIQKEFMRQGLEIQADMLFHSTLPFDKFEKEKGIVLEELARDRADSAYLARLVHREFAYAGTPLARSVLGTEDSIGAMEREAVLAYYRSRYVPSNMTLVLIGDFEIAAALPTVVALFGNPTRELASTTPTRAGSWPPRPDPAVLRAPIDADRAYLFATLPLPLAVHDRKTAAVEVLLAAIADGSDAPLAQALTSGPRPKVYSFSLTAAARSDGWASVDLEATLPLETTAMDVLESFELEIRGLQPGSPAWDRIAAVRSRVRTDEVLLADRIHYYAMMLSPYIGGAPEGYLRDRVASLEALTTSDLQQAAAVLRAALAQARATILRPGVQDGRLPWDPNITLLATSHEHSASRVEVLDTGLEILAHRSDDSRVFALHVMFRPRSAVEPEGKEGIADFLHRLYMRGTELRNAAGLDAALASLGASVKVHDMAMIPYDDYYTTPQFSFLRMEMPADRWREGIALVAEVVLHPRLAPDDVEAVRSEMLDLQRRTAESPGETARFLLADSLAPDHPAAAEVLGTPESVRSITVDDLRAFHDTYVTGRRTIVTASGPVDPATVVRAVSDAFDSLSPGGDHPPIAAAPVTRPGRVVRAALGKGQAYLALGYLFESEATDREALAVAGALLSDRLSFSLREQQGLAYTLSASFSPWAGRTRFAVVMGTRPENVDAAQEGLRRELAGFSELSFDAPEVRRAATALRGRRIMRRMTRVNQAYFAAVERLEGRPRGDDARSLDALLAIEPDDIRRVVDRYFDPDRAAVVIVR